MDYKNDVDIPPFPIGHSSHQSKTFYPIFHKSDEITYTDIAGQLDSNGLVV